MRVAGILGCGNPPDDFDGEGGGKNCPNCRTYLECQNPDHGKTVVGDRKRGHCFRTNACARCVWAALPGVGEVAAAHWWAGDESVRALARERYPHPPAVLLDALEVYGSERNRCRAYDIEHRPKGKDGDG